MAAKKNVFICPDKGFDHTNDSLMTCHGNLQNPIRVMVTEFMGGEYIEWEYHYAAGEIGSATRCSHALIASKDHQHFADRLIFRTPKGRHHAFYFDVTEIFKRQLEGLEGYQGNDEEDEDAMHA